MSFARKSPGAVATYDPVARRQSRAWGLLAYLVVLVAVATVVIVAARYQPLSAANLASGSVTQSGPNMLEVQYRSGGTLAIGFLLVNDGPFPAQIQRIQMTGPNELLIPVRLETASKKDAGSLVEGDPSLSKFLPFRLTGGDRRWIVLRTRFGNCARFATGSFETYTRMQVTYSMVGFTKHAWVDLPKDIRVDSPPDSACPTR
jgi:hypothetical protein